MDGVAQSPNNNEKPNRPDYALQYLRFGYSIIPLAPNTKKPLLQWQEFQNHPPEESEVQEWFHKEPSCNIGIVTGKVSRLLALDVDGELAKICLEELLEKNSEGPLDSVTRDRIKHTKWTQTGSGGYHILLGYSPEEFNTLEEQMQIKNAVLWRSKQGKNEIRLKSDGGYIVAPPSIHPNGRAYRFIRGSSIAQLSNGQILDLIGCFKQIDGAHRNNKQRGSDKKKIGPLPPIRELDDEHVMDIVVILKPYYLKGQRHEFVLYLCGWLRKEGVTIESAHKVIEGLVAAGDDDELNDRLATVEDTYLKESLGEIKGYQGLLDILEVQVGSLDTAHQVLKEVEAILPENRVVPRKDAAIDSGAHSDGTCSSKSPSASELAIGLVDKRAVLYFKDEYGNPHIKVKVGDHTETIPVGSSRFELYVSKVFYDEMDGQVLKTESLNEVVRILTSRTVFDGVAARLHLRTAWEVSDDNNNSLDYNTLYYDPTNENWSCIKITTQGWEILPRHPDNVLFTRFKQLPQVTPVREYPPDIMDKYLDLMHIKGHAARLLVKVMLIASFIPDIGHPITIPNGEQGGVKSTYCRYHKRIVDPCAVELLTIPKDRNEFVQHMHHNYVVIYDNVRIAPKWFSDEICKAVTGAGNSKRKLYTDDDDIAYNYKRCILVNGINNVLTEPDALDRSIMLDFTRISDEKRREEAEVDAEFEAMKPLLLGYVLDILVKALSMKPTIKLGRKPRMADFSVWGEAIARTMGCKELEFLEAYYSVLERQNVDAVEATLVGPAIVNFVNTWPQGTTEWEGSPDALLDALRKVAEAFRIETRDGMWPKKGNSLTRKLKPLLPDLRQGYDIDITITRNNTGKTKSRNSTWIAIRKISPQSPPSPPACSGSADNGNEGGYTPLLSKSIPPPQEAANGAQKSGSGGSGDGGDNFRLPLDDGNTGVVRFDGKDYIAFDLEWKHNEDDGTGNNSTIYAAAFVDNHGNQKVLHISDFANSEPALLQAITDEILRYPASIGWYTTGITRGGQNNMGGASEVA